MLQIKIILKGLLAAAIAAIIVGVTLGVISYCMGEPIKGDFLVGWFAQLAFVNTTCDVKKRY